MRGSCACGSWAQAPRELIPRLAPRGSPGVTFPQRAAAPGPARQHRQPRARLPPSYLQLGGFEPGDIEEVLGMQVSLKDSTILHGLWEAHNLTSYRKQFVSQILVVLKSYAAEID
ncbi:hypothetical protein NDU88_002107 [Pleurodeles waltl]|uniref:Uncharacterized protein n=1 Tax=Pleurodeles waltl TaxID=8319 RepID=A0AAV7Q7R8_PLEWA|nr:hypothetical protein NDU88_002107 [Pleurodeles waltl]